MEEIFNTMGVLDGTLQIWKILVRIALAIIAGLSIGLESNRRLKDAGIKTHTLLCLTSCVLMVISKYGFYELAKMEGIQYDASRVASTIISGLCFIGAGMLFFKQYSIKGLTTAVSLCLTISIGMCFGSGLLITGCIVSVLDILLQFILHKNKGLFKRKKLIVLNAKFYAENGYIEKFKRIFDIDHFEHFKIVKENDKAIIEVEFLYKIKISSEEIFEITKYEPEIIMVEKN